MRKLKFRAWDIRYKKFFQEFDWDWCAISKDGELVEPGYTSLEYSSKDVELMQFTGLIDNNGREIYEGDIVEWDDGSKGKWRRRCEIKWEKTKYILVGYHYNANIPESKKTPIDFKFGSFIYEYDGALEIIGNIYENNEMMTTL